MTNQDDEIQLIIDDELKDIRFIAEVFHKNINRSLGLIHESRKLVEYIEDKQKFKKYMDDILRASIVFLHSTLEVTLRDVVRLKLKYDADLSSIGIVEEFKLNRKDKFTLNDLAKYRGYSVDDVVNASIDSYLSTLSFNNARDISNIFRQIDLPKSELTLRPYYVDLDALMNRRHQIAHEGDMLRNTRSSELESIDVDQLIRWINSIVEFSEKITQLTFDTICIEKITKRLQSQGIKLDKDELLKRSNITVQFIIARN